jgi:hypothetical protein
MLRQQSIFGSDVIQIFIHNIGFALGLLWNDQHTRKPLLFNSN